MNTQGGGRAPTLTALTARGAVRILGSAQPPSTRQMALSEPSSDDLNRFNRLLNREGTFLVSFSAGAVAGWGVLPETPKKWGSLRERRLKRLRVGSARRVFGRRPRVKRASGGLPTGAKPHRCGGRLRRLRRLSDRRRWRGGRDGI